MSVPSIPVAVWLLAAFDPVLVLVALVLGWRADQPGKVFIAAIAALGITLLVDALLSAAGIPLLAPLTRDGPMLLPVRSLAALAWAAAAFGARRLRDRSRF